MTKTQSECSAETVGKIAMMNCGPRKKSARLEKSTRLALCAQSKNALYAFEISANYMNQSEYGRKLAPMVSDTTSSHTFA